MRRFRYHQTTALLWMILGNQQSRAPWGLMCYALALLSLVAAVAAYYRTSLRRKLRPHPNAPGGR